MKGDPAHGPGYGACSSLHEIMRVAHVLPFLLALVACATDREAEREENVIENRPGRLVLTSPARAAFIEEGAGAVEVRGTGATSALTIDGQPAEVAPDGSFHATVRPKAGLNLVVAVDGDARLESPFLYGKFAPATTPVGGAVTIEVGSAGINAAAPAASLMSVTNAALAGRDLVGMMKGQMFAGQALGVTWSYVVSGGHHGAVVVDLGSAPKGIKADASMRDLVIEGMLTIQAASSTTSRFTRIIVDRATIAGDTELAIEDGAFGAAMPEAVAQFEGFRWDSGNLGFPCCVDGIATGYLKPKLEEAIRDGIRTEVPKAMKLTLDGMGLPKTLDLTSLGLARPIPISARLESGDFDSGGARITTSLLFGGAFQAGEPGAKAPGWLKLGSPPAASSRPTSLGASFSLDAVNQLLFAAWGSGALSFATPPPLRLKLAPGMPPVMSITEGGAVRLAIGELLVQQADSASPLASVTMVQDVVPAAEQQALVLTPKGEPTISITWLADGSEGSGKNLIAAAAKDQVGRLLKPFRLPLPRFALDQLGGGFTGTSLGLDTLAITVDPRAARLAAAGTMTLTR